jgi:hypothetical protein
MKRCDRLCASAEFIERALLAWPFLRRTSIINLLRMETMRACSILLGQLHETLTSTKELRGLDVGSGFLGTVLAMHRRLCAWLPPCWKSKSFSWRIFPGRVARRPHGCVRDPPPAAYPRTGESEGALSKRCTRPLRGLYVGRGWDEAPGRQVSPRLRAVVPQNVSRRGKRSSKLG